MSIRAVYTDLDGTMVGPGGCFFRAVGATTLTPARALVDLLDAGVTLVLVSGRTRPQLIEAAAIFGADGFIAEMGSIVGWATGLGAFDLQVLRGAMPAGTDSVPEDLLTELIDRHPGRLELHTPWHSGREIDVMLRGNVPAADVDAWLADVGYGWLSLRDNGLVEPSLMPGLDVPPHVYHLVPDGVGKGDAVAWDLARRGIAADEAIAVGDSASDLEMARFVGRMHLVANAVHHPGVAAALGEYDNLVVEDGPFGVGWASAVSAALASPPSPPSPPAPSLLP